MSEWVIGQVKHMISSYDFLVSTKNIGKSKSIRKL